MSEINKYIQIDDEGMFVLNGERLADSDYGQELFKSLYMDERHRPVVDYGGIKAFVEASDQPFVVQMVEFKDNQWVARMPYSFETGFNLETLSLDEWDRFHGFSDKGVAFVMSRKAQNEFFNLLDEFDDDSISFKQKKYTLPIWPGCHPEAHKESFWSEKYSLSEPPGWELGEAAKPLVEVLPQLKMVKCRVLVLGCGNGHDAAYLAKQGHIVTAIDISPKAIDKAKELYGEIDNLKFVQADALELQPQYHEQFDLVFEHTFYCAIPPERRNELVKIWKSYLADGGHFLGIFFTWPRPLMGPPFAGSEYEIKKRLEPHFKPLYWTRWKSSIAGRKGIELVVYANLKN